MVRYIVECRDALGALDFTGRQPESAFGMLSILGMTIDTMANMVWEHAPARC